VYQGCKLGTNVELDKEIEYLEVNNCSQGVMFIQSCSFRELAVINGSHINQITGTPLITTIADSTVDYIQIGGIFGRSNSLVVTNSTIGSTGIVIVGMTPSLYTFIGNGIFRTPGPSRNDPFEVYGICAPGHQYVMAYNPGGMIFIDPDSGPRINFCITDMWDDGTFIYLQTDLGNTLPTPTFMGGNPSNYYWPYPLVSASGPANVLNVTHGGITLPTVAPNACAGSAFPLSTPLEPRKN
jgi:hypothetical protein